ncbi:hypothetical protein BC938DRAFT_482553 [Jimgerdemannia flammicorona]|uniref:Uncharacterized protein n=1 Tax=Jimgerdemannia flammicorona TaxID=994334 RepID=A0A433QWC8_9FUNG|nr:hypothetical protein BC938DRAFT_482553 [Jimgerdemannia flammicorona]
MGRRSMKSIFIKYRRRGFSDVYPDELSGFLPESVFHTRIATLNTRLKWRHPKYGLPLYLLGIMVFFIVCGAVFVFVGPFATQNRLQYMAVMAAFGASWFLSLVFFLMYVSVSSKFKKIGTQLCVEFNARDTLQYNVRWNLVRKHVDAAEADDEIQQGWCVEIRPAQSLSGNLAPVEIIIEESNAKEKEKPMEERGLLSHAG